MRGVLGAGAPQLDNHSAAGCPSDQANERKKYFTAVLPLEQTNQHKQTADSHMTIVLTKLKDL